MGMEKFSSQIGSPVRPREESASWKEGQEGTGAPTEAQRPPAHVAPAETQQGGTCGSKQVRVFMRGHPGAGLSFLERPCGMMPEVMTCSSHQNPTPLPALFPTVSKQARLPGS